MAFQWPSREPTVHLSSLSRQRHVHGGAADDALVVPHLVQARDLQHPVDDKGRNGKGIASMLLYILSILII